SLTVAGAPQCESCFSLICDACSSLARQKGGEGLALEKCDPAKQNQKVIRPLTRRNSFQEKQWPVHCSWPLPNWRVKGDRARFD
ncbi:MAG: hypothetical protein VB862_10890, partial [Pirellulaceae bacterium]